MNNKETSLLFGTIAAMVTMCAIIFFFNFNIEITPTTTTEAEYLPDGVETFVYEGRRCFIYKDTVVNLAVSGAIGGISCP